MTETWPVAIGIPVRNEVERLPRLLRALAGQRNAPPFALNLLFDNCTDGSREAAAALADGLPYPIATDCCDRGGPPNAGLARGRAMAGAAGLAPSGILLTTDADGEPAPDWVASSIAGLAQADVVCGRIVREPGLPCRGQDRIEAYYDRLHALRRAIDPVGWEPDVAHHWTSGASLAMRTATYRTIGGFPAQANGEDAALCDMAERAGLRVRRDPAVVVRTSSRRHGRADAGFAAALARLDRDAAMPAVTHPEGEAWRFRMQAAARARHGAADYTGLARDLGLGLAEVTQVAGECRNGTAFAARIVGAPPGGSRTIGFDEAECLLASLERPLLSGAA